MTAPHEDGLGSEDRTVRLITLTVRALFWFGKKTAC